MPRDDWDGLGVFRACWFVLRVEAVFVGIALAYYAIGRAL